MKRSAIFALLAVVGSATSASAIVFSGPAYTPPGGASCGLAGNAKLAGGATWTCSQTVANYSNLYIGIKNDNVPAGTSPQGESMDNNEPTNAPPPNEVFVHSASGATTITYTGTTQVRNLVAGPTTFVTAFTRLTLTFTGTGSMVTDATTMALSSATNGAVHSLWRTTAASFTVNALLEASDSAGGPWTPASTYYGTLSPLVHGKNTASGETERSHVDIGFYYSRCGDSLTDTSNGAEECDLGGSNGSATTCCTAACQFRAAGQTCRGAVNECDITETCSGSAANCPSDAVDPASTPCTDDGNVCTNDQCNGTIGAPACLHPNNSAPCADGTFCNGADTCSGGACVIHAGDPCSGPDGDGDCSESCDEGADNCLAADLNGSACTDGLFCTGTDTCTGGTCTTHTGDPCSGPDGDGDCSETCDEGANNCNGSDPNGSGCNDSLFCNGTDTCNSGSCNVHTGDPCPGVDGDGNCSESCDEVGDDCDLADPNGSACTDALFCNGTDTCSSGSCTTHTGDPCDGPDGDGDCSETCDESADDCDANDPNGSTCTDSVFCNGTDTCSTGLCNVHTGDPCDGPDGDLDCTETCNEGGANCNGADPDGTLCRADSGQCDVQETCLSGACPVDDFEANGFPCGSPTDTDCDNADTCNGSNVCLSNLEANGFPCGDLNDTDCSDPDTCDGSGICEDNHEPNTVVCRAASAGQECDAVENCDGSGNCPADGVLALNTLCRGVAGDCDVAEVCDGVDSDCPPDQFEPNSVVCRPDTGDCDIGENCTGTGANCPADDFELSGTPCGSPGDTDCDNPDTCNGNNACIINNEPSGTACTTDGETCTLDVCDGAATCTHDAGNLGTECRPQAMGQLCDEPEECDGVNTTCPADAVKANGEVCRPDLGECDDGESCDGVSSLCPPDISSPNGTPCGDPSDTFCANPDSCLTGVCEGNDEPTSLECRAASAGQACDVAENCDGAGNCPADAPATSGTECRAAAGACDVAETCDGSSFDCPAIDGKSTAVCRPSAGVCDLPDSCDGINDDCPALDAKSTAECRPAANLCDVAENCDGTNNACPINGFQPNNTPCPDGQFCNGAESCQTGICSPGGDPCPDFCDEGTDMCLASSCATSPLPGCRTALKSLLLIKNKVGDDAKDRLVWKWIKGQTTSQMDFADPTMTAYYGLCIYDGGSSLIGTMDVPPGSSWTPISDKGYKYLDLTSAQDGAFKIKLKGSTQPKAKALVKGRGVQLPDPLSPTPLTLPVRVQLVNNQTGICFESVFNTPKLNTETKFKAKTP